MPGPEIARCIAYHLYQWVWTGLDWLYPPLCGGCGKPGDRWCVGCQSNIEKIPESICSKCGQVTPHSGICQRCRISPPSYDSLRSWAVFSGPIRNAIHRLKYRGDIALGEVLARPLIELAQSLPCKIDAVVPVPIGIARKAERGYNQAAIIGLPLALGFRVPYRPHWLKKVRETRSQVGLTIPERKANLVDAFKVYTSNAVGKRILVIDDVATSGATIEACSVAFLNAGACEVYGLTLARSMNLADGLPGEKIFW